MIPFILLLPILAAIGIITSVKYLAARYARYIALAGALISLALLPLIGYGSYGITWFSFSGIAIGISSVIAPLNMLLLAVVLVMAPVILFYSFGFMQTLSEQRRFYIEMLAFEAAMLLFAMAGDLVTLFIAWEFLSLLSYLLIGFWHTQEGASRAARKAITVVLIGDIALLASIVIFWSLYHSLSLITILHSTPSNSAYLYLAAFLLIVAVITKSAQFPFQEWLPDAMEGPTPVSAFLHSTTMVKAGVFAMLLLYPIFYATKTLWILVLLGGITAVLSTLNAMKEAQIKRVIAYSTVQELSLMIVAAGSGAILACLYFFLAQSFYKALLFFSSGSAMKASGEEDLNRVSGLKSNRLLYITTIFGVLALAGFIPFAGFFVNLGIGSSLISNVYLYALISLIGLSTSFFIFRWLLLASKKPLSIKTEFSYSALPKSMLYSSAILLALLLLSSAAFFYMPGFLSSFPSIQNFRFAAPSISYVDAAVETCLVALGALASYLVYRKRKSLRNVALTYAVYNARLVNGAYAYFSKYFCGFAEGFAILDSYIDEAFDGLGRATVLSGGELRKATSGSINIYLAVFSVMVVILLSYIYLSGVI